MSTRKLWTFRILALVLIPVLLFGGLEAGLRLAGYGYSTKALLVRDIDGEAVCCPNPRFTERFFSPEYSPRGFYRNLVFKQAKEPGTFRIFVLGGSAARGTPKPKYNVGRLLEAMLRDMYPDIRFEVHNAAIVAINSHVVREIADDCATFDPDLFIVYLGNNEVVGPYGPGTVLTAAPGSMAMIRASIALKSTRTGQLLDQVIRRTSSNEQKPKEWRGMEMFIDKQIRSSAKELGAAYDHFEKNLQAIFRTANRADAPVVISNVGVNLKDSPPFASLHGQGLSDTQLQKWEQLYNKGIAAEEAGNWVEAVEHYLAAEKIDAVFAELQFRLGRCLWESGDYENARMHYRQALQHDTLRFRADEQINETIRSAAAGRESEGIYFVDSVAAFEQASPHRTPGENLFFEHVHLNFKGNYELARALLPAVQQQLPAGAHPVMDTVPSEEQVARAVGYNPYEQHEELHDITYVLLTRPPFTNQLYHEDRMESLRQRVADLEQSIDLEQCLALYEEALKAHPDDWRLLVERYNLLLKLEEVDDLSAQETQLRQIIQLCYFTPAYMGLADVLTMQGKLREAEDVYLDALEIDPALAQAYYMLARLVVQRGDRDAVIEYIHQGLRIARPETVAPYGILADTYDKEGKPKKAIEVLRQGIEEFDGAQTAMLHYHLALLLHKEGEREQALEHMDRALELFPAYGQQPAFRNKYSTIQGQ